MKKYIILTAVASLFVIGSSALAFGPDLYQPSISSFSPEAPAAGNTVVLSGSNFMAGAVVIFDGEVLTPTLVQAGANSVLNTITFVIPANTASGVHTAQVLEKPYPISNSISIKVSSSNILPPTTQGGGATAVATTTGGTQIASTLKPHIESISPEASSAGATVTLRGYDFGQDAVVLFDNSPLTPTSLQADKTDLSWQTISFAVPVNTLAGAHTVQVQLKSAPLSNTVYLKTLASTSVMPPTPVSTGGAATTAVGSTISATREETLSKIKELQTLLVSLLQQLMQLLSQQKSQ